MMGQGVKSKVPRPEVPLWHDEAHYDNQSPHVGSISFTIFLDAYVPWLTFATAQVLNIIHCAKLSSLSIRMCLTRVLESGRNEYHS